MAELLRCVNCQSGQWQPTAKELSAERWQEVCKLINPVEGFDWPGKLHVVGLLDDLASHIAFLKTQLVARDAAIGALGHEVAARDAALTKLSEIIEPLLNKGIQISNKKMPWLGT